MIARASAPMLGRPLSAQYAALRRAGMLRYALRAAAAIALALAVAVAIGAVWPPDVAGAWVRLGVLGAAALAALAVALARLRREIPGYAAFLETVETRFPELRSLLRNALELEAATSAYTSDELAAALRAEAARRLPGRELAAPASVRQAAGPRHR